MKLPDPYTVSPIQASVTKIFIMIVLACCALFFSARADAEAANPSSYSLIGTIVTKGFVGAVINDTKGEQTFYRIYTKLPDGMQIVEVRGDSISLKDETGTRYDIYINHEVNKVGAANQSAQIDTYVPVPAQSNVEPGQPKPRRGRRQRVSSSDDE